MSPSSLKSRFVTPQRVHLKGHPELNEKWIQGLICADPSIIGLGKLRLVGAEKQQPSGGRLDILLADQDGEENGIERYAVEVQLGKTDPSHIIRTIEYWDVERTSHPEHNHTAVLIAEDVTSRFANVISLFNKAIPIIAIQMQAHEVGQHLTLIFTIVTDLSLHRSSDDEAGPPADRSYWEKKSKMCLEESDEYLKFLQGLKDGFEQRYNQDYISVISAGSNLLALRPVKNFVRLKIIIRESDSFDQAVLESDLPKDYKYRGYRFKLDNDKNSQAGEALKKLIKMAVESYS